MAKRRSKRREAPTPPAPEPSAQLAPRSTKKILLGAIALLSFAAALYYFLPPSADAPATPALARGALHPAGDPGYIDSSACAGCHAEIAASYAETGMGRAFYPATRATMADQVGSGVEYFHEPSQRRYSIFERDGKYFQRRWQTAADGRRIHDVEREIHFVMGSGNHARTYLHRQPNGKVIELPLGWYAESGGFFAMNPGFDQARHGGLRREISFDCMGCHNGYPTIEAGADSPGRDPLFAHALPSGIDCQRCHGPGRAHVEAVQRGAAAEEIRAAMFNPAEADPQRQLEVCLQCHLESTSRRLPYSVHHFDRGAFSYRPGEPLADFVTHFDHPAGVDDGKFEIAHHGYQFLRSRCFRQSEGMTCTTCHDPHQAFRGAEAKTRYAQACAKCHESLIAEQTAAGKHPQGADCIACHMPKRRTDDVVHVVMTDHSIPRRPPPSEKLLATRKEVAESADRQYRGPVIPLLPASPPALYTAVAQVAESANLAAGTPELRALVESETPPEAGFYYELAEAYWQQGEDEEALPWYRAAIARDGGHLAARRNYAFALAKTGNLDEAETQLRAALVESPDDPEALVNLADVLTAQGRPAEAASALEHALRGDPDSVEALHNLSRARAALGQSAAAVQAARMALDIEPGFTAAHNTLGNLLLDAGSPDEAEASFRRAIAADAGFAEAHYNLASILAQRERYDEAEQALRAALRADPKLAMAHNNLGGLLAMRGDTTAAEREFRAALAANPRLAEAHFNLGVAQASSNRLAEARKSFEKAIELQPDYPEARLNLAVALAGLGEREAAKAQLKIVQTSGNGRLVQAAMGLANELE
ncbi:MAG: tetratricopeptide repeat protein [Bryobacterales bacterium]|nr:tetratricopeptide repeat protein [Bryobacterales bacterium]